MQSANKNGDDERRKVVDECLQLKVAVSSLKESLENSKQILFRLRHNESLKNEIDEILSSKKQEIFSKELFQQNIENLEATYKAKIIETKIN